MQGSDIEKLGADWKAFRNRLEKMADESTEEAGRHVRMQELPVEVPFTRVKPAALNWSSASSTTSQQRNRPSLSMRSKRCI